MIHNYLRLYAGTLLLVLTFLAPGVVSAGFGVSPAKIIETRLVKGSVLDRVVYFVQGTPDADLAITLSVDDGEIGSWISITPTDNVIIPKGIQQFPVTIRITVPRDAKTGIYKGFIRASARPVETLEQGSGSGVSIVAGAVATIELTVGEGVYYEYVIRNLDLKNIKEHQSPSVDLSIENKGNVPAGPAEASFELFNKYGDVRLAYVQGVKIARLEPFITKTVNVEFPLPLRLSVGEYWGLVRVYNDSGGTVREFKGVFNVTKSTFLDKYSQMISMGLGILLLLVFLLFILKRIRNRSKK